MSELSKNELFLKEFKEANSKNVSVNRWNKKVSDSIIRINEEYDTLEETKEALQGYIMFLGGMLDYKENRLKNYLRK